MTDTTIIREALEASYETMWAYDGDGSSAARLKIGAALAALGRLESPWRPISEAPRDGTRILSWDGKAQNIAFWGRSNPINRAAWIGGHCRIDHIDQPTHFMPLPQPPKDQSDE